MRKQLFYKFKTSFVTVLAIILLNFNSGLAIAASIEGSNCSKSGLTKVVNKIEYYCDFQHGDLKWWRNYPDTKQKTNSAVATPKPKSVVAYKSYKTYKAAYDQLLETSQEELRQQGFFKSFGVNGKPVLSKIQGYCKWRQVMLPPYNNSINNDQLLGCVDAAMTLYIN
jgi:hypothetical protein